MTVTYDPYRTTWRLQAGVGRAGDYDRSVLEQSTLYDWLVRSMSEASSAAYNGHGHLAGELATRVRDVLLRATPMELIELALERAEHLRPVRGDSGSSARRGRYASLAITALEEARGWERDRMEVPD